MPAKKIQLKEFNNRFSKIIDALEKTGLSYIQIEDVMLYTFRQKRTQKVINLINENLTFDDIANKLGYTRTVVHNDLNTYYNRKMEIHEEI